MSELRDLFGGAIVCSLPTKAIDASELRQVPDTQEVFVMPDSELSIIFEVLELVARPDLLEAIRYHFDAIAHDNEAATPVVQSVEDAGTVTFGAQQVERAILRGTQQISKLNKPQSESDVVHISLALWRIHSKKVDFVAILNDPSPTSAASEGREIFQRLQSSLEIRDFGLFA